MSNALKGLLIGLVLLSQPVRAQEQVVAPEILRIVNDWQATTNSLGHLQTAINDLTRALGQAQARLRQLEEENGKLKGAAASEGKKP